MATDIRAAINAPYQGWQTYSNLLALLQRASVGSEFWGKRYIYIKDLQGTYPLEHLYDRITNLERRDQDENRPIFTAKEREIGLQICVRVTSITTSFVLNRLSKIAFLVGVLIHVRRCFRIIQFESFHPQLIANGLIGMSFTSFIMCLIKTCSYSYYWQTGVGSFPRFESENTVQGD